MTDTTRTPIDEYRLGLLEQYLVECGKAFGKVAPERVPAEVILQMESDVAALGENLWEKVGQSGKSRIIV